jgi:hypothetical protein
LRLRVPKLDKKDTQAPQVTSADRAFLIMLRGDNVDCLIYLIISSRHSALRITSLLVGCAAAQCCATSAAYTARAGGPPRQPFEQMEVATYRLDQRYGFCELKKEPEPRLAKTTSSAAVIDAPLLYLPNARFIAVNRNGG